MSKCKSCGAEIVWARTEASSSKGSKNIPLDADAEGRPLVVERGNLVVTQAAPTNGQLVVRYVPSGQGQHQAHFVTCPHAREHRRKRNG